MYKGMFDENHKLILQPSRLETVENWEIKKPSDGEYEGGLLCKECDNILLGHYYEDYASKAMYGGQLLKDECPIFQNCINQNGIQFIKCDNLNYHKFKLFLLSVLWRANISTRPFFSEINLDKSDDKKIRQMILTKNGGRVDEFPIFISSYVSNHKIPKQLIAQPRLITSCKGLKLYSFMINGYFYFYYVNKPGTTLPLFVTDETIKPSNNLNVIIIPEEKGLDFIVGQLGIKSPNRQQ